MVLAEKELVKSTSTLDVLESRIGRLTETLETLKSGNAVTFFGFLRLPIEIRV